MTAVLTFAVGSGEAETFAEKIAGLTPKERIEKSCTKLGVDPVAASKIISKGLSEATTSVILAHPNRILDWDLLDVVTSHTTEPCVFVDGPNAEPIGLAKLTVQDFQKLASPRDSFFEINWSDLRARIPTRHLDTMERYEKEMRKIVRPRSFDPIVTPRKTIEQHLCNYADKGTNDWVAKYPHAYIENIITRNLWPLPKITPNMLTISNMFVSLVGVYCFATGAFLWGTIWANVHGIIDGVDGRLARTTVRFSKLGHYLDHVQDQIADALWYVAMGWALRSYVNWPVDPMILSGTLLFFYFIDRITTGVFASKYDVQLHDYRKVDRIIRTYGARRSNNFLVLLIGGAIGEFPAAFLTVLAYTIVSTFLKVFRFGWIRWRGLQTDIVYPS